LGKTEADEALHGVICSLEVLFKKGKNVNGIDGGGAFPPLVVLGNKAVGVGEELLQDRSIYPGHVNGEEEKARGGAVFEEAE
jgi:hypothetical protein